MCSWPGTSALIRDSWKAELSIRSNNQYFIPTKKIFFSVSKNNTDFRKIFEFQHSLPVFVKSAEFRNIEIRKMLKIFNALLKSLRDSISGLDGVCFN